MTQTRLGERSLDELEWAIAAPLGRKGLETLRAEVTSDSSVYDAYNHLRFVSRRKQLGPRRELEMIVGGLLAMATER